MFMPKAGEHPVRYWLSFSPMAPLFGVPWRFEGMIPGASFFRPADVMAKMAQASAAETAQAVEEVAAVSVRRAEAAAEAIESVVAKSAAPVIDVTPTPEPAAQRQAAPPKAAQPPQAAPAPTAEDAAPAAPGNLLAAAPDQPDDLKLIKGVGPKLEEMLNGMGIYRFDQIAVFSQANLAWVSENLTSFKTRPLRDDWVAQAKALM